MSGFFKPKSNVHCKTAQNNSDELVLEDSIEETETVLGNGIANVFKGNGRKAPPNNWNEPSRENARYKQIKQQLPDQISPKGFSEKSQVISTELEDDKNISQCFLNKNQVERTSLMCERDCVSYASVSEQSREKQQPKIHIPVFMKTKPDELREEDQHGLFNASPNKKVSLQDEKSVDANKPHNTLRMKLTQIKAGIYADNNICLTNSKSAGSELSSGKETTSEKSLAERSETSLDTVQQNCCSEEDFAHLKVPKVVRNFQPVPLELETAKELKKLLLGSSSLIINEEWKYQGFSFTDCSKLSYGLIQKKNGPCGIYSTVQAFLLKHILFTRNSKQSRSLVLSPHEKTLALATALANIFWQAGQNEKAVVAILGKKSHLSPCSIRTDGITEKILVITVEKYEDLLYYLMQNIEQFNCISGPGVILCIYSTILSCTVKKVYNDMDDPNSKLINDNGTCSQELVNLVLTGCAVTNVFNHSLEVRDCNGKHKICKGITSRSEIGLLSLSECHNKSLNEVGTFLKTPKYPIWLLRIEDHFCVLFSTKKEILLDWKAEKKFDLLYYNSLNRQNNEIRLTVDNTDPSFSPPLQEEVLSTIELCIRTKWNQADIHWNGTQPPMVV